jgi:hypothetical protein
MNLDSTRSIREKIIQNHILGQLVVANEKIKSLEGLLPKILLGSGRMIYINNNDNLTDMSGFPKIDRK